MTRRLMFRIAPVVLVLACAAPSPSRAPAPGAFPSPAPGTGAAPPLTRAPAAGTSSSAARSPVLVALNEELSRGMAALKSAKPPPYYIAYRARDRQNLLILARTGAVIFSEHDRDRILDVEVRVGDHAFDSSRPSPTIKPLDTPSADLVVADDPAAIKAVAWRETDRRYKAAAERLAQLRAQRAVKVDREDQSDDFSKEPPVVHVAEPVQLGADVPALEERMRRLSRRFTQAPELLDNEVVLRAGAHTRWMVTSEGTMVQAAQRSVSVELKASLRSDDGMDLRTLRAVHVSSLDDLPSDEALAREVDAVIADVRALRAAPLAEPYVGPAIFSGRAAAVLFHEALGHFTEAFRLRDEETSQTFAKKLGQQVVPPLISVYDDPGFVALGPTRLVGTYEIDDEGVAAQRASLVERGVLKGFLLGRAPVRGFTRSNGHGRGETGRPTEARMGNLIVEPSQLVSPEELRRLLLAEVKRQGRPYGLLFSDLAGGRGRPLAGETSLNLLLIKVYRVWPDGRPDELVRGADLAGTPLTVLNKVRAAAGPYEVFNGECGAPLSGGVPQANVAPSLLFDEVELQRKRKGQDRPPVLPPPPATSGAGR